MRRVGQYVSPASGGPSLADAVRRLLGPLFGWTLIAPQEEFYAWRAWVFASTAGPLFANLGLDGQWVPVNLAHPIVNGAPKPPPGYAVARKSDVCAILDANIAPNAYSLVSNSSIYVGNNPKVFVQQFGLNFSTPVDSWVGTLFEVKSQIGCG